MIHCSCKQRTGDNHLHVDSVSGSNRKSTHDHSEENGIVTDTIKRNPFHSVFKTGGVITAGNENIVIVTAKSAGIIRFIKPAVYPGTNVKKGQLMFIISGGNLTEDNPVLKVEQLRADLARAKENYERAQKLLPDRIITRDNFLAAKNEYEKLQLEYENISLTFSDNEVLTVAPADGFVREIFVSEGQKVSSGETVASIQNPVSLVLKVLVPPDKLHLVSAVRSAWFRVPGSEILYKTGELNGRIISFGKSTGVNSLQIPLLFAINYIPEVPEGSFAEVFLLGEETDGAITVPDRSIMEEYGHHYVFIRDEDGDYLKRYITTGPGDGERTLVTGGLEEGEVFVSDGAYQVKLRQMQGSVPAHVHNH
ncbi:MAG: efflux RND transporter periplasmic adaptor subunit [Bacteroidales bacterium]|nr:efflux RND transporter periplasmic adaptor subunit [Bacteroidales bacterium]